MITDAIKNFPKQFEFEPVVENKDRLFPAKKFIVAGMGGSHLAADLLRCWKPSLDLTVHHDYGLPPFSGEALKNCLVIASSYSGNTEETIDAFEHAYQSGFPVAALAIGGKLLDLARSEGVPYVQIPDTGIQPRSAVGFSAIGLLKLMGEDEALKDLRETGGRLNVDEAEGGGRKLAEELKGLVPVIYSSSRNEAVAANWKIRFNETGKIPSFYNVFPELNHNELIGFDAKGGTKDITRHFAFIFLRDGEDHLRVKTRMEVQDELYRQRGLKVAFRDLEGATRWDKIFSSLLLADWTAYHTAKGYGLDAEEIELVEEFKRLVKERSG